jgi:capsular exopolysaccharide synthesis family protein
MLEREIVEGNGMDLQEFIRVIRTRWASVALVLGLGIGAAVGVTALTPVTYTASTTLYISVQATAGSATEVGQGNNAAQQKTRSYANVVKSARVLGPVIKELGLDVTPATLARSITAGTPQSTVLLTVAVRDHDPELAAKLANAIGRSFTDVVSDSLEKPVGGGTSLVRIETTDPATVPTQPSGPHKTVNLAAGLAGGLIGGIALALLRNAFDTRIRRTSDIGTITPAPVLGEIAFDANAAREPLIVRKDPRSTMSEAFRGLRTNLLFVDPDADHGKTIVVTSAMQGEGKTTTTANLALTLAENGAKVAFVDADLRRPRVAEVMGLEGAVGLSDLLIARAELEDVVQPWGSGALSVIPAGATPPNPSELLGSQAMRALIAELESRFDHVLIDSPPLLPVTDAAILSKLTAGAIVVTAAGRSRRPQLKRALEVLAGLDARVLGIVATMVHRKNNSSYGYGYGYGYGETSVPTAPDTDGDRAGRRAKVAHAR